MPQQMKQKFSKKIGCFLLIGLLTFWAMWPVAAEAYGTLLSAQGTNVQQESLNAVIVFDGKRQTTVLKLDYNVNQGKVQDFGWVMPTPSKPQVVAVSPNVFLRVKEAATPKKNYLSELFDLKNPNLAPETPSTPSNTTGVTVVSQTKVGAFDIKVVAAYEQQALKDWAAKNGYNNINLYTPAIREYITQGWYFVIAKLQADKAATLPQIGQAQPIALTFDTPEVIYPWRLAAYGPDGVISNRNYSTQFYVFKPDDKLAPKTARSELRLTYAENLDETTSRMLLNDLPMVSLQPYFLTSYSGDVPARTIEEKDLSFGSAGDQSELNSGKLNGSDWVWAFLGTLFYGSIALLATLWLLFTGSTVGVIAGGVILALIYAFTKPEKPRRLTIFILTTLAFLLSTGMTIGAIGTGTPFLVVLSIIPMAALTARMFWRAFLDKDAPKLFKTEENHA